MAAHSKTTAIILAAGKGTRMRSPLPKVLHRICGAPMVDFVIDAALAASADDVVVVVGHRREDVEAHLRERFGADFGAKIRCAVQSEQKGTGHAVSCAMESVGDASTLLLLNGDGPLLWHADLRRLLEARQAANTPLAMVTCVTENPHGYGRILRTDGNVTSIVEQRDCAPAQLLINEVNPGVYAATAAFLKEVLPLLAPNNEQGELYLTDIVQMATERGGISDAPGDASSFAGINDRNQLARAESAMFERIADAHRNNGATIRMGAVIEATVTIEADAVIEHGVVLRGMTQIASGARIDVGCVLDGVSVASDAYLRPYSVCTDSQIGTNAQVGPFSHLRPASRLDEGAKVGNFVEIKKTHMHAGAKANHLAYLGDGEIFEGANIGAGTIFCNYDGFMKHRTVIGRGAFIGSDSQLVAPVTIGDGAYVATGTTVTKDVPADGLAIARVRQDNKLGYGPRLRSRLAAAAKKAKAAAAEAPPAVVDDDKPDA